MDFYSLPVDIWGPYYSVFKGLLETGTHLCLRMTMQPQHQRLRDSKSVRVVCSGDMPISGQPLLHEPSLHPVELM